MIASLAGRDGAPERLAGRVYDVCVVGAGPAGLTLALALAERGRSACVLEAGGEGYVAAAQDLLDGEVRGAYPPLRTMRMSVLGGSSQVWAGWCRPLDPEDFEPRPRLGSPGWPFGRESLLPYYRRAHEVCGLAEFEYDPAVWSARTGERPLVAREGELVHRMFHVRARQFGVANRTRLAAEPDLDLLLRAPVLAIELDEGGAARYAVVRPPAGGDLRVEARTFVLAAGGIENARLLLLSGRRSDGTDAGAPGPDPDRAPGNAHGLVGRFFMDHPFINPGWLALHGARGLGFYFPRPLAGGGPAIRATLGLDRGARGAEDLPGAALFFHPRYEAHPVFDDPGVRAFLELRDTLRSRAVPRKPSRLLRRAARSPGAITVATLRKLLIRDRPGRRWRVRMMFETAARHENRVELCEARDPLGRPRVRIHWRVGDEEVEAMRRTLARFDAAFRRAGVGRIEPTLDGPRAWLDALEGGKHHMGTTRMHSDPRQGVVGADGRVHGTPNLYVAGSSTFPGVGYANPTLTIVALALRLADRLTATVERA